MALPNGDYRVVEGLYIQSRVCQFGWAYFKTSPSFNHQLAKNAYLYFFNSLDKAGR